MDKLAVEKRCNAESKALMDKYFGDFAKVSGVERPEKLEELYTDRLPSQIAEEYKAFLRELWAKMAPEGAKPFDEIMNLHRSMQAIHDDYEDFLPHARENAETITLWEKIARTNHKDVTFYKGILKQYTEELLDTMTKDFLGDIQ